MFEYLDDPTVLTKDLVATRPHLAFTIYDEVSIHVARATGLDFHQVLAGQQILFRFLARAGRVSAGQFAGPGDASGAAGGGRVFRWGQRSWDPRC